METKYTKTPWSCKTTPGSDHTLCTVFSVPAGKGVARHVVPEDAAFIVRTCNSHEALLEACKIALDKMEDYAPKMWGEEIARIKAAIAAEGGE